MEVLFSLALCQMFPARLLLYGMSLLLVVNILMYFII